MTSLLPTTVTPEYYLTTEAIDGPEEQGKDDADQDRGREGKGDRPSTTAPGEISGETAKRKIQATEAKDDKAGDNQQ
jgi:hypothetical protein